MLAEQQAFNENASKTIFEGINDVVATCSSNTSAAQKFVTIAGTSTSILNQITKLRPGAKGDSE